MTLNISLSLLSVILVAGTFFALHIISIRNLIEDIVMFDQQPKTDWIQGLPVGIAIKELETQFILQTLKHHNGNRTHAAKTLGISLRTLRNRINEFTNRGFVVVPPTMRAQATGSEL